MKRRYYAMLLVAALLIVFLLVTRKNDPSDSYKNDLPSDDEIKMINDARERLADKQKKYKLGSVTFEEFVDFVWQDDLVKRLMHYGNIETRNDLRRKLLYMQDEPIIINGSGYSTDSEDFPVTDYFEDETDTRYLDKMPERKRSDDYYSAVLSEKIALEIIAETRKAIMYTDYSGAPYFAMDEWFGDENNYTETVYYTEYDGFVEEFIEREHYYVPPLDTVEEFEEYFLPILGEEYVENLKRGLTVEESDGRIKSYNSLGYIGYILSEYWDKAEVARITQERGSYEAVAVFKLSYIHNNEYDAPHDYTGIEEAKFVYTDEYGWQLVLDQETYNWLC